MSGIFTFPLYACRVWVKVKIWICIIYMARSLTKPTVLDMILCVKMVIVSRKLVDIKIQIDQYSIKRSKLQFLGEIILILLWLKKRKWSFWWKLFGSWIEIDFFIIRNSGFNKSDLSSKWCLFSNDCMVIFARKHDQLTA